VLVDYLGPKVEIYFPSVIHFGSYLIPYFYGEFAIIVGFLLLSYGANFVYTFAAFEAFRLYGYQNSKRHVLGLWTAIQRAQEVLKKDDDTEGIDIDDLNYAKEFTKSATETVQESLESKFIEESGATQEIMVTSGLSTEKEQVAEVTTEVAAQLSQHLHAKLSDDTKATILTATTKIKRILKAVDPKQVSSSAVGLVSGILSVLATLTVTVAQAITIGSSLGDTFYSLVESFIKPYILQVVPREFQKWVYPLVAYGFKLVGILIAYFFAKWILTLTICTKGGQLILMGVQASWSRLGQPLQEERMAQLGQILFVVSILGVVKQFFLGYDLPNLLMIFLFPFAMFEWALATFVVK